MSAHCVYRDDALKVECERKSQLQTTVPWASILSKPDEHLQVTSGLPSWKRHAVSTAATKVLET